MRSVGATSDCRAGIPFAGAAQPRSGTAQAPTRSGQALSPPIRVAGLGKPALHANTNEERSHPTNDRFTRTLACMRVIANSVTPRAAAVCLPSAWPGLFMAISDHVRHAQSTFGAASPRPKAPDMNNPRQIMAPTWDASQAASPERRTPPHALRNPDASGSWRPDVSGRSGDAPRAHQTRAYATSSRRRARQYE